MSVIRPQTNFARIRRAKGITVKELAEEVGMSMDMIFRFQREEQIPIRAVRRVLAEVLGAPESFLFPALEEISQPRTDQRAGLPEPASTVAS